MASFRFSEQKVVSLRHKITEEIRQAIFEGKLKPGDRIRETEISKQMGVSRGPIREAMRVLEQEGLLFSHPYKETTVAEFSKEEVIEVLIPIRLTIELFAIRKGLSQMAKEDVERLAGFVQDMKEGAQEGNLIKVVDSDLSFHEYIVHMSNVNNLMNIWSSIYNRMRIHFLVQGRMYSDLNEVWSEHDEILRAFKERTVEKACLEMTKHIFDANVAKLTENQLKEE